MECTDRAVEDGKQVYCSYFGGYNRGGELIDDGVMKSESGFRIEMSS